MKASLTALTSLALLLVTGAAGCGMFSSSDEGAADSTPPLDTDTPAPTRPSAPPPLEGTPATSELDEVYGVFVVANAAAGGDGTRARPFATIGAGIESATTTGKRVYVCEGTYRESLAIVDGVSMVGGFDCSVATWKIGNARTRIDGTASPAITATAIAKPTRFDRFEVFAPDGASSVGIVAIESPALTIAKSRIVAGNAGNGADGVEAAPLVATGDLDGQPGMTSRDYCWRRQTIGCASNPQPVAGGAGGTGTCGTVPVGSGVGGGSGGVWQSTIAPGALSPMWVVYAKDDATFGAKPGGIALAGGFHGQDGASATTFGVLSRAGFFAADGTRGTDGSVGDGGNGGAGFTPVVSADNKGVWFGVQGSGGGAGGCGGVAGSEGKGGGASIAAFVVDGAVTFESVELVSKKGGDGGKGTFGSRPTPGGKGGPVIDGVASTKGQDGSPGGFAGVSGSGAGGPSIALVHFGARPSLDERTSFTVGEPGRGVPEMTDGTKTIAASPSGEASAIVSR